MLPGPVRISLSCVSSGAKGVLEQAFEMVRRKGRGNYCWKFSPGDLFNRKMDDKEEESGALLGQAMYEAHKLMEFKRVNVRPVITRITPLEEAQRAFESLREHKNLAVLLKP